jgi:murein DD-endopeptidase MepM/ murein hydrolase activator NlpD
MKRLIVIAALLCLLACAQAPAQAKVRNFKYGTRPMRTGVSGKDVKTLQGYLNTISLATPQDAVFGASTRHSVKAYEAIRRKPRDGIVQTAEAKKIRATAQRVAKPVGSFRFPVLGPHNFGGPANAFGAPRNGHIHQGQDVMAACGLPLVAAQGGYVRANAFQAGGAGNYVVIRGATTFEDYMYAHLAAPSTAPKGTTVTTGQQIGVVGQTGDATACHLHFEMWTVRGWYTGGAPYDPLPSLTLWDSYS